MILARRDTNLHRSTNTGKKALQWISKAYNHSTDWRTWLLDFVSVKWRLAISLPIVAIIKPDPNQLNKTEYKKNAMPSVIGALKLMEYAMHEMVRKATSKAAKAGSSRAQWFFVCFL